MSAKTDTQPKPKPTPIDVLSFLTRFDGDIRTASDNLEPVEAGQEVVATLPEALWPMVGNRARIINSLLQNSRTLEATCHTVAARILTEKSRRATPDEVLAHSDVAPLKAALDEENEVASRLTDVMVTIVAATMHSYDVQENQDGWEIRRGFTVVRHMQKATPLIAIIEQFRKLGEEIRGGMRDCDNPSCPICGPEIRREQQQKEASKGDSNPGGDPQSTPAAADTAG